MEKRENRYTNRTTILLSRRWKHCTVVAAHRSNPTKTSHTGEAGPMNGDSDERAGGTSNRKRNAEVPANGGVAKP